MSIGLPRVWSATATGSKLTHMTLAISKADLNDAAAIAELGRITFAETFTHYEPEDLEAFLEEKYQPNIFREIIASPEEMIFKATLEDKLVGYAHAGRCALPHPDVTANCGELKRLYVKVGHQGAGIGSGLLAAALDWLVRPGRKIWIGVFSLNFGARKLYESHGFRKVGDYKFVVGKALDEEFILMRE